jgi:hypothetical protein
MTYNELARLFLGRQAGTGTQLLMGATLTTWDAVTFANTVVIGGTVTYTNLPVINPAAITTGRVLLANTPAGPIILGRIHQAT